MALARAAESRDSDAMDDLRNDPSRIVIRRGEAADAAALAVFGERMFLDTFGPSNDPAHIRAYLDEAFGLTQQSAELADPDTTILLATFDDALVAYAQLRRGPAPACVAHTGAIELQRFYLDRPAHGSGLASTLMDEVRATAAALGAGHLWLGVWENNARAIAFYVKCGYADVGRKTFDVGSDRQVDRVMVAPLATAEPSDSVP
jgi:ribosomal protein S18 acetylase RimI-like enzyme